MFEPKTLYRAAVEEVPEQSFECTIGKADILRSGNDVTLIGWGTQIHVLNEVAEMAKNEYQIDCEVIDLVSILPWDRETVCQVCTNIGCYFCLILLKIENEIEPRNIFCLFVL